MHSIGPQPASARGSSHRSTAGGDTDDADQEAGHVAPLSGPHDYETRVQSYLQSLKAYIESANTRKKWVPGDDGAKDEPPQ